VSTRLGGGLKEELGDGNGEEEGGVEIKSNTILGCSVLARLLLDTNDVE
jgi:hypothetical protein